MRKEYPVWLLCEVLDVSRSCYYAWKKGQTYQLTDKNKIMEIQVIDIFREHKRRYGCRRVVAELYNQGVTISQYKVRRLFHSNGLIAIQPRSYVPKTTNSRHPYRISPNLLKQRPAPLAANQVYLSGWICIPEKLSAGI
jgi:putative transposase